MISDGKAFDQMAPKPSVTDPLGYGRDTVYPKHLHKAGVSEDGGPVYLVVQTADQEAEALADGWLLEKPPSTLGPTPPPPGSGSAPIHPRRKPG